MRDTYCSENAHDFSGRYRETYGWLIKNNTKQFVYLYDVQEDRVLFTTNTGFKFHVNINSNIEFEFIPVDRGWFYDKVGNAWYLHRVPERQWKRGISNNNTAIFNDKLDRVDLSYDLLASIFALDKPKFNNLERFHNGIFPIVLSRHFCLTSSDLLFYNREIGNIVDKKIVLTTDVVMQEIKDSLKRNNIFMEVTNASS